jgi:uncharacterized membrane protein
MVKPLLVAYLSSGVFFIVVDVLWLALVMSRLFKAEIGELLLDQPRVLPAVLFYALYPVGLAVFGVLPGLAAQQWLRAAVLSALFGLLAYATYDLTNLATLKAWSAKIALIDIVWGSALSFAAGWVGYLATNRFAPPEVG